MSPLLLQRSPSAYSGRKPLSSARRSRRRTSFGAGGANETRLRRLASSRASGRSLPTLRGRAVPEGRMQGGIDARRLVPFIPELPFRLVLVSEVSDADSLIGDAGGEGCGMGRIGGRPGVAATLPHSTIVFLPMLSWVPPSRSRLLSKSISEQSLEPQPSHLFAEHYGHRAQTGGGGCPELPAMGRGAAEGHGHRIEVVWCLRRHDHDRMQASSHIVVHFVHASSCSAIFGQRTSPEWGGDEHRRSVPQRQRQASVTSCMRARRVCRLTGVPNFKYMISKPCPKSVFLSLITNYFEI